MHRIWKPTDYNAVQPLGSYNNPYLVSPYKYNEPYYLKPENLDLNYLALYLGYRKRIAVVDDTVSYSHPDIALRGRTYYYFTYIYKQSHDDFQNRIAFFTPISWCGAQDILQLMRTNKHFDKDVRKAVLTLDDAKIYNAIINKIKSLGTITPDLTINPQLK